MLLILLLVCCCSVAFSDDSNNFVFGAESKARAAYLETLTFPDESELMKAHFGIPASVALPTQPLRFDTVKKKIFFCVLFCFVHHSALLSFLPHLCLDFLEFVVFPVFF
jgi:hypothetical protein